MLIKKRTKNLITFISISFQHVSIPQYHHQGVVRTLQLQACNFVHNRILKKDVIH